MSIFLTGVSCVGKTTVGAKLAALLGCPFFDLDHEVESFFSMPIERLKDKFLTMYSFRQEASNALKYLLKREESGDAVMALSPSGLMDNYWRVVKRAKGTIGQTIGDHAYATIQSFAKRQKHTHAHIKSLVPTVRSNFS
jgi:shikimate kinase